MGVAGLKDPPSDVLISDLLYAVSWHLIVPDVGCDADVVDLE